MTVRRFLPAAALLAMITTAAPAFADPDAGEARRPGQVVREQIDELLRGMEKFIAELPRYDLPEIAENGDIVMRRKHSEKPPADRFNGQDSVVDL